MTRVADSTGTAAWSADPHARPVKDPSGRVAIQFGPEMIPRLQELCRPDGRVFSLWVVAHLGVFAVALFLIANAQSALVQALLSLVVANQLHAITVLQHDCGHGSAYQGGGANLWVGRFLAGFIFMPYTTFTVIHRRHHMFLGDPKKDPDEWFYAGGPIIAFVREMIFMPYFTLRSLIDFGRDVRRVVLCELAVITVLWTAVVCWLLAQHLIGFLVWGILLPMALLAIVINPISRGYEHYPMAILTRGDRRREDLRFNTVTVTSRLLGVLWANITYHVEHHLYPRVPCHRLPVLHRLLRGRDYVVSPFVLHRLEGRPVADNDGTASPGPHAVRGGLH
jgi:beta-carotene hydroxylase